MKKASDLADYATRFASALHLAADPRIRVSGIEAEAGLRYTVETVRYLQARHRDCRFVWLMGADNLAQFHRWRAWREIARLVPIAILDRAPFALKALHGRFAQRFAAARIPTQAAPTLASAETPRWLYLTIPRHPLSATMLRKTLGKKAFLRHNRPSHS